jgi:hypothetical protein
MATENRAFKSVRQKGRDARIGGPIEAALRFLAHFIEPGITVGMRFTVPRPVSATEGI